MKFENEICYGCGKVFTENDDVVVCPECGTPQHRECYNKEHKCINEHLHCENFVWKPKHAEADGDTALPKETEPETEAKSIICPFCGHVNSPDATVCENCSQPFEIYGRPILPKMSYDNTPSSEDFSYKPPFEIEYDEHGEGKEQYNSGRFVFGGEMFEDEIYGVSTKDISMYIRASVPNYLKKFRKMRDKKITFNFAAFFFNAYWAFFRKLYKLAIIFLTVNLCISIVAREPLTKCMDETYAFWGRITQINEETTDAELQALTDDAEALTKEVVPTLLAVFGAVVASNLVLGFIADKVYRKKVYTDIKAINEEAQGDNEKKYFLMLNKGGVSVIKPLLVYIGLNLFTSIILRMFF